MKRKDFLKTIGMAGAVSALAPQILWAKSDNDNPIYQLPPLGYRYDALEPHIDARTMEIHHTKHHQAYVNGLNSIMQNNPQLRSMKLERLFAELKRLKVAPDVITGLRNHGGGHWNHSFFWQLLKTNTQPQGKLVEAITRDFGSMEKMQAAFERIAMGRFGSGWAWLISNQGKLAIIDTANQDNPLMATERFRGTPIIGVDVWEHAYYLNYQNKRADYLKAFWQVCNWEQAEKNYLTTL